MIIIQIFNNLFHIKIKVLFHISGVLAGHRKFCVSPNDTLHVSVVTILCIWCFKNSYTIFFYDELTLLKYEKNYSFYMKQVIEYLNNYYIDVIYIIEISFFKQLIFIYMWIKVMNYISFNIFLLFNTCYYYSCFISFTVMIGVLKTNVQNLKFDSQILNLCE